MHYPIITLRNHVRRDCSFKQNESVAYIIKQTMLKLLNYFISVAVMVLPGSVGIITCTAVLWPLEGDVVSDMISLEPQREIEHGPKQRAVLPLWRLS